MQALVQTQDLYRALEALPEGITGQIINGELIASPRPALDHARTASVLGMDLGGAFERGRGGPGGWWILDEPELHFGNDVLVPDLAGWRRSRLPQPPRGPHLSIAPNWLCEVLSPSTAGVDRVRKLPIYARQKVAHVWLIDPVARTLEVFRGEDPGWRLIGSHGEMERIRAEPFEELELELGALWLPEMTATPGT